MWNKLLHHPNTPLIFFITVGILVVILVTRWATKEEKDDDFDITKHCK